tara:strand:- start:435 stop:572 length:138 start_codon:yes stop_codon:yes gene_type:complete
MSRRRELHTKATKFDRELKLISMKTLITELTYLSSVRLGNIKEVD